MSKICLWTLLALVFSGIISAAPHGIPYSSVGLLTASRPWNPSVSGPELSWKIEHPGTSKDLVHIDPQTGSLTTRADLRVRVHVLGVGEETSCPPHRATFWTGFGRGGGWQLLFDGKPKNVSARTALLDKVVLAGTSINLSARGYAGEHGERFEIRSTGDSIVTVKCLSNGDPVPPAVQKSPAWFLSPYLSGSRDGDGQMTVQTGPGDLVVFFELNARRAADPRYDLQDLVVLISFERG